MSHSFIDNSPSFTPSSIKDFCQKWKVQLIFEASEKVRWLDLTDPDPQTLRQIYATGISVRITITVKVSSYILANMQFSASLKISAP